MAAAVLAALLGACEVHKPADTAALRQDDASQAAPDLLGGPSRTAKRTDHGFVLLGGPARTSPALASTADAAGQGDEAGAFPDATDPAQGGVIWGYGAPRAVAVRHAAAIRVATPMPAPDLALGAAPLETELLTPADLHLDTGPPPPPPVDATPAALQVDGGSAGIGFGRIFSFMLCMLGAGAVWRWRGVLLERQAAEAAAADPI